MLGRRGKLYIYIYIYIYRAREWTERQGVRKKRAIIFYKITSWALPLLKNPHGEERRKDI